MKTQLYKLLLLSIALVFAITVQAQKVEKKFLENFSVNKDVTISINASNTEINVETWNKNQVLVEAIIEVEGLSKKEAEKYIRNYQFEALGNKDKVKITSQGRHFINKSDMGDIVFFNHKDFVLPEIHLPDFDNIDIIRLEDIEIPEIDFENMNFGLDNFDFDFDKYTKDGKNYFFRWKDSAKNITIKSKEDWEKFKKTKEYQKMKRELDVKREKMKVEIKKAREEVRKINKEEIKKQLARVKIDREKIKEELAKAKEQIMKIRYDYGSNSENIMIDGKKIKVKKVLNIKVPKGATFDLNTRYSKITLPRTVASGTIFSGSFFANSLQNSNLNISYAPVTIQDLNACTLFLKNISKVNISSVSNSNLNLNSASLIINKLGEKVNLRDSFGEINIKSIAADFETMNIDLRNSTIKLPISNITSDLEIDYKNSKLFYDTKSTNSFLKKIFKVVGENKSMMKASVSSDKKSTNTINLKGNYSVINII